MEFNVRSISAFQAYGIACPVGQNVANFSVEKKPDEPARLGWGRGDRRLSKIEALQFEQGLRKAIEIATQLDTGKIPVIADDGKSIAFHDIAKGAIA